MRNLTIFVFVFGSIGLFSQSRELNHAVKIGTQNQVFSATFDIPQKEAKIKSWCSKNGYEILSSQTSQIERFGDYVEGITRVQFMEKNAYYAYQNELLQREKELSRIKAQQEKDAQVGTIVTLVGAAIALGIIVVKVGSEIMGSSGSYSDNANKNVTVKNSVKPCFGTIAETTDKATICETKIPIQKIKCKDEERLFFEVRKEISCGIASLAGTSIGFYKPKYYMGGYMGESFLDKDFDKAMRKLCSCNE